jgi:hypothetical protein
MGISLPLVKQTTWVLHVDDHSYRSAFEAPVYGGHLSTIPPLGSGEREEEDDASHLEGKSKDPAVN